MKQLGGMDASFLYMETPQTPMHVAGLSDRRAAARIQGQLLRGLQGATSPDGCTCSRCCKKKLVQVPWDIDHPLWVDDDELDLDYHIRHLGLPKPGTMQQLEELVGRLHSNFLDRSRPLWEFYVIDGLADGHIAIYTKIHHAAVDGGAGMALDQHDVRHHARAGRQIEPPPAQSAKPEGRRPTRSACSAPPTRTCSASTSARCRRFPDVLKAIASVAAPVVEQRRRALPPRGCRTSSRRRRCSTRRSRASAPSRRARCRSPTPRRSPSRPDQAQRRGDGGLRRRAAPLPAREARPAEGAAGGVRAGVAARARQHRVATTRSPGCCAAWRPTSRTRSSG